jgi:lipopolysaccharide export LptBFGC system permease protein LptF
MRLVQTVDRYIFYEAFSMWVVGLFGFLSFLLVNKLFLEVQQLLDPNIPPSAVIRVVLLEGPNYCTWALPVATLFATLWSMSRLAKDNELDALFTNGISLYRLFMPYLLLSSISVLMAFVINEYVVTVASGAQQAIYESFPTILKDRTEEAPPFFAKLDNGEFIAATTFDKDSGILRNVVIDDWSREGGELMTAADARSNGTFLNMGSDQRSPAIIFQRDPLTSLYKSYVTEPVFQHNLGIDLKQEYTDIKTPQELTQTDLARQSQEKKARGENPAADDTNWHLRFAVPFSSLAFALVAMPLSLKAPRDERLIGLVMSFVLVMVYYVIYFIFKLMGENSVLPPWIAAWAMNIIYASLAFVIFLVSRK